MGYGSKVEKVKVSQRIDKTPAIMVTSQFGYSANMERIIRSQAFADPKRAALMRSQRIFEINPRHPIVIELLNRINAREPIPEEQDEDEETEDNDAKKKKKGKKKNKKEIKYENASQEDIDMAWVMFDVAALNSGFQIEDAKAFSTRMYSVLKTGLNLDSLYLADEIEVPDEEEEEEEEEEEDVEYEEVEMEVEEDQEIEEEL